MVCILRRLSTTPIKWTNQSSLTLISLYSASIPGVRCFERRSRMVSEQAQSQWGGSRALEDSHRSLSAGYRESCPAQRSGGAMRENLVSADHTWYQWPCSNLHLCMMHEPGRSETHDWSSDERVDSGLCTLTIGNLNANQIKCFVGWNVILDVNLTLLVCEILSRNARTRRDNRYWTRRGQGLR